MSTELVEVQKAVAEFDRVAAGLNALQQQFGGVVFDVTTTDGMKAAKAARLAVREPRYEVERIRKAAKAPILALGRKLDDEAKRITAALETIENPIDTQIRAEEDRKEAERQARIAAEEKRIRDIQDRIAEIRGAVAAAALASPELVLDHIGDIERIVIDDSYAEFRPSAEAAKAEALAKLRELHAAAVARAEEAARLKAEREELERLRAIEAQRQAEERARLAAEERAAKEAREAEAQRVAAELRKQREEQEAERSRQQQELDRQRAELAEQERAAREAREAEEARIAAERAALEREQEAARIAAAPSPPPTVRPTDGEIVAVLAEHYGVDRDTVIDWLAEIDLSVAA